MQTPNKLKNHLSSATNKTVTEVIDIGIQEAVVNPTRTTHNKLTKQLQNSLWLRICSGRIAFMLCWQLQNSTKFHFGNTKTNNKSICTTPRQRSKIIGKNRKQQLLRRRRRRSHPRRTGAVQTTCILKVTSYKDTDTTDTDRETGIAIGGATALNDAQLLARWIRSSSSASSGTVIRLTWQ